MGRIEEWLNAIAQREPENALMVAELYLTFVKRTGRHLMDYENSLTQLLTRLFAQAEEIEESDGGKMLMRVVVLQDILLELGLESMNEWLRAAERP